MSVLTGGKVRELTPEEMKQVAGGIGLPEPPAYLVVLRTVEGEFRSVVLTEVGLPFLPMGEHLR